MQFSATFCRRFRGLNLPGALLMLLLQRTPVLNVVAATEEILVASPAGAVLKSVVAVVAALGGLHTIAGASTLAVSAGTSTGITVAAGSPMSVSFSLPGSDSTPNPTAQWTLGLASGSSFPPGLNFSGLTGPGTVMVKFPQLSGTPTTAGTYHLSLEAFSADSVFSSGVYSYAVTVTGSATSAPAFTTQPSSQTVTAGSSVTFTSAASGTPAPTYQWQKGGVNISGATSANFSIASAAASDAGDYMVIATNSNGSATSSTATLTVNPAPVAPAITTQPTSQSVTTGTAVTFTAAASGSPTPTYQWQKGGVNISGATTTTLSIASAAAGDAGNYTVVATNSAGSTTSSIATLTVNAAPSAPAFTTQPTSQSVTAGSTVSFTSVASGTPTPTYQWQKGGVNISGATNANFNIASVAASDAGSYTVVATNASGSVTSSTATLTVNAAPSAPSITTQPASQSVTAGASVTFTAAASGTPTPTYQWQKGGVNISGATSTTFSIASVATGDAGNYTVIATNATGSVTSSIATLTVNAAPSAPTFTTQPASQIVNAGSSVTFTSVASGTPTPTFQWQKAGGNISGATNSSFTIASVAASDAGSYTVVATNASGTATSNAASLTIGVAASNQVTSETVTTGHGVTFSAGNTPGSLQWQISTDGGSTWTSLSNDSTYSGVTTATLAITNAGTALNNAKYRFVATTGGIVSTSNAATLSVAQAFFPFPTSIAVDNSGNLYVGDANADIIQKITSSGQVSLIAGTSGTAGSTDASGSAARFNQPAGLTLLANGTLIVADTANATIRSIASSGAVTTLAGSASNRGNLDGTGTAAMFSSPVGISPDANGVLYVADAMNDTIRKITAAGVVTTFAGTAGVTGSTDGNGAAARFNFPNGLVVDGSGNVYVADTTNNTIRKITSAGDVTTLAGVQGVSGIQDGTGSGALFNHPEGLAVDGSGNIYLADTGNSTIRKITPAGVVTTLAGLPGIAGLNDGTGSNAFLNQPQALSLDSSGNVYVADTGNAAIRKITPSGAVTTLTLAAAPVPTPTPTPSPTPTPTPTPSPSTGGGGGGGAFSPCFFAALSLLGFGRRLLRARI